MGKYENRKSGTIITRYTHTRVKIFSYHIWLRFTFLSIVRQITNNLRVRTTFWAVKTYLLDFTSSVDRSLTSAFFVRTYIAIDQSNYVTRFVIKYYNFTV